MARLHIQLSEDHLQALRRYADQQRTSVPCLIEDYVDYLLAGGTPVDSLPSQAPTSAELAEIAQRGGAFDWLADEPALYTEEDGEPV